MQLNVHDNEFTTFILDLLPTNVTTDSKRILVRIYKLSLDFTQNSHFLIFILLFSSEILAYKGIHCLTFICKSTSSNDSLKAVTRL